MHRATLMFLAFSYLASTGFAQTAPASAQTPAPASPITAETYLKPQREIAQIVDAPRHLNDQLNNLSPNAKWFLETKSPQYVNLESLSRPYLSLAGIQVDPAANRSRTHSLRGISQAVFIRADGSSRIPMQIPNSIRISRPRWSPSGKWVAFFGFTPTHTTLWLADPETGKCWEASPTRLMPTLADAIEWTKDETSIFLAAIPTTRPNLSSEPAIPTQPRVLVSDPSRNRSRPLRNLLETDHDKQEFEYYTTSQIVKIDLKTKKATPIGAPAMIRSFSASADGTALRVSSILKPFSYIVMNSSFGSKDELWSPEGKVIEQVSRRNLQIGDPTPPPTGPTGPGRGPRPGGGAGAGGGQRPTGGQGGRDGAAPKRSLGFRPDGNGLTFLQLEPLPPRKEGEAAPASPPTRKDRVMQWVAPYGKDDAKVVYQQDKAINSVSYSESGRWLFITQTTDAKNETIAIDLQNGNKATNILSVTADDFYNQPGTLVTKQSSAGGSVVRVSSDNSVFLRGTQYSKTPEKEAPRPFLDKVDLTTGTKSRVWQSSADQLEDIDHILNDDATQLIVSRETANTMPQLFLLDTSSGSSKQLTNNVDYSASVTKAQRFRIQITRVDGFKFWAKVTMPDWWSPGYKLPAMFWFYPSEFTDQKDYDDRQRTFNKNAFQGTGARSMSILTLLGYAVVEPDCPIVGPAERKNDAYIPHLRNSLSATIDELEKQGFIDRSRLGIGGHSYGAFSTANAMVHTPFFKVGIAGDGNYNRLLTPMAFQAENRTLWDAREVYLTMSPFLYAEQFTGALLMYHGIDDNNPGTHPINSERMFNALDGLGKDVALYMYPYEDHNAICMETILDMWARWIPWLEKYLSNKPVQPETPSAEPSADPNSKILLTR